LLHTEDVVALENYQIRSAGVSFEVITGRIKTLDLANNEVSGYFELVDGVQIPRGLPGLRIDGELKLEVKSLSSVITSSGKRRYRFVATCAPEVVSLLDLMMNSAKHPTVLENMMH
jgi:hypothetical protein